jgi:hypothetical protein
MRGVRPSAAEWAQYRPDPTGSSSGLMEAERRSPAHVARRAPFQRGVQGSRRMIDLRSDTVTGRRPQRRAMMEAESATTSGEDPR